MSAIAKIQKNSLTEIFEDENKLSEYIQSLEFDIESTSSVDATVDELIENLLKAFDGFKDRRSLRASNIDAMTNLLKFKTELPLQRIRLKKTVLDIMTKKKELEIKEKTANAASQIAENSSHLLRNIFLKLDEQNIHPIIDEAEIIEIECSGILEKPKSLSESISEEIDVAKLQESLDLEESEGDKT